MDSMDKYKLAESIASVLAENYLASDFGDMMIEGGKEKAKIIKERSDKNINTANDIMVNKYREIERIMLSAVFDLIEDNETGYILSKTNPS